MEAHRTCIEGRRPIASSVAFVRKCGVFEQTRDGKEDGRVVFFACENTGLYTHDCMDYFDSRLPNTYILKSSLTFQARKYYAKADFKTDLLDSAVVALTLNDLHQK